jgi:hypothetical protein
MPGRRIGTHPTSRPLRCERCRRNNLSPAVTVAPGVEKLWSDGRYRPHANVSCNNGHSWWSVHPEHSGWPASLGAQRLRGEAILKPEYRGLISLVDSWHGLSGLLARNDRPVPTT